MPWVYVLRCADDSFYVGSTQDLEHRLGQHVAGVANSYTVSRRPVQLVFAAEFDRVDEAWAMEVRIKGWRRAKKIALIEGRLAELPSLSRTAQPRRSSTEPAGNAIRPSTGSGHD